MKVQTEHKYSTPEGRYILQEGKLYETKELPNLPEEGGIKYLEKHTEMVVAEGKEKRRKEKEVIIQARKALLYRNQNVEAQPKHAENIYTDMNKEVQ